MIASHPRRAPTAAAALRALRLRRGACLRPSAGRWDMELGFGAHPQHLKGSCSVCADNPRRRIACAARFVRIAPFATAPFHSATVAWAR